MTSAITARSAARMSFAETLVHERDSAARASKAPTAISRSPVTFCRREMSDMRSGVSPTTHLAPEGRTTCPSVSDESKSGPAFVGPSQSDGERTQSQTHAAPFRSGSRSASVHSPQPHDHTDARSVSFAIAFAESACHLATRNHAEAGWSPARPPAEERPLWKPSMTPSFDVGIPISEKSTIPRRIDVRRVRLARIGPWRYSAFALG